MDIALTIILTLFLAHFISYLLKKLKMTPIVASILSGLIIGLPFIKNILIDGNKEVIFVLGDIALISLMFLAGLESSWRTLYTERKDSGIIALFGFLIPFLLSFLTFWLLGFSTKISLIVGICLSITAEATKARVLLGLKKLKTRLGAAMLGAGILDDFLGLVFFVLINYFLGTSDLLENFFIFAAIISFFIGIIVQRHIKRESAFVQDVEKTILWAVFPFFFISIGLHFDFTSLIINPIILLITICVAFFGKMLGVFVTKPFTTLSVKQLYLVGWAMNSRGAIEMALALLALRSGLIPIEVYSALIITAITTTTIFPAVITRIVKRDPKIMNIRKKRRASKTL